MAEKKKPDAAPVGVTYMMVPTGEKAGDTLLFAIRRVEFDGKETRSAVEEKVRPATRIVIRERLRILMDSPEVVK